MLVHLFQKQNQSLSIVRVYPTNNEWNNRTQIPHIPSRNGFFGSSFCDGFFHYPFFFSWRDALGGQRAVRRTVVIICHVACDAPADVSLRKNYRSATAELLRQGLRIYMQENIRIYQNRMDINQFPFTVEKNVQLMTTLRYLKNQYDVFAAKPLLAQCLFTPKFLRRTELLQL